MAATAVSIEITSRATHVALDSFHTSLSALRQTHSSDPTVIALLAELDRELAHVFLSREVPFMKYRGHALKRDKAFFVDSPAVTAAGAPEELFRYRYPGFQHESMMHYRAVSSVPSLQRLLTALAQCLTFEDQPLRFNHVIATRYRDGADNIGWHNDKMHDITPGTPIVSLSLGTTRDLQLRPVPGTADQAALKVTSESDTAAHTVALRHGDIFVLGPQTNQQMQHCVPPVKAAAAISAAADDAADDAVSPQARISLVFRSIRTHVPRAEMLAAAKRSISQKAKKRLHDNDAALRSAAAATPATVASDAPSAAKRSRRSCCCS